MLTCLGRPRAPWKFEYVERADVGRSDSVSKAGFTMPLLTCLSSTRHSGNNGWLESFDVDESFKPLSKIFIK